MRPKRTFLADKRGAYSISNETSFRSYKENMNLQLQPCDLGHLPEAPNKLIAKCPTMDKGSLHSQRLSFVDNYKTLGKDCRKPSLCNPREVFAFKSFHEVESMSDVEVKPSSVLEEYGHEIEVYERSLELCYLPKHCLRCHEITPGLRAKMVDWMVEVMTSFKCKDQTFFMAVSLMDRYLDKKLQRKLISELHVIGVTAMFLASKYEDILPLRMSTVVDKIAHRKLSTEIIRRYEDDVLETLDYYLQVPTVLEFLTRYVAEMEESLREDKDWVGRMSVYLAKLAAHDCDFCSVRPSKVAVSAVYVALKICEQLKKRILLNKEVVRRMVEVSGYGEGEIVECAQKVLSDAQNFESLFPGLTNLKKTHFNELMECVSK